MPAASFLFSFLRCYEPAAFFKPEITLPAPYAAGISLSHAAYTLAGCKRGIESIKKNVVDAKIIVEAPKEEKAE